MKLSKCTGGEEYEAYISLQVMHFARRLITEPGVDEVSRDILSFVDEHCLSFTDVARRVDYNAAKLLEVQGAKLSKLIGK